MTGADDTNADAARSSISAPFLGVAAVAMLVLGYPLSLGPAAWIYDRVSSPTVKSALEAAYWPLDQSVQNTPLEQPLYAYVELFR